MKNFNLYYNKIDNIASGNCKECKIGHYLNHKTKFCEKCRFPCLSCKNENKASCSSCIKGFTLKILTTFEGISFGECVLFCGVKFKKNLPFFNKVIGNFEFFKKNQFKFQEKSSLKFSNKNFTNTFPVKFK